MELILSEILKALGYLFIAGLVYIVGVTSRTQTIKRGYTDVLFMGFCLSVGIAFLMSVNLGRPTCIDSETDTRGTTCNEYDDDGYKPTTEQRAATFAYYMTLIFIPVAVGTYIGKKEKEDVDWTEQNNRTY